MLSCQSKMLRRVSQLKGERMWQGDAHEGSRVVAGTAKLCLVDMEKVAVPCKEGCAVMCWRRIEDVS
jgi:hypothetical protein